MNKAVHDTSTNLLGLDDFEEVTHEEAKQADGEWTRELFNQSFQEATTQEDLRGCQFPNVRRRVTLVS